MKSLMKKSLALVLMCAVAFGCMCIGTSAAAEVKNPAVSVSQSSVAAKPGETVQSKISFANVGVVAGIQFKIEYDAAALTPDVNSLNANLKAAFGDAAKAADANGVISIVAVKSGTESSVDVVLPFEVKQDVSAGVKKLTVTNLLMVDNSENAINSCKSFDGSVVVNRVDTANKTVTEDKAESLDTSDTFVPFGSAYTDGGEFFSKNSDGSFDLKAGDVKYDSFKLPEASIGFTTFGTSENIIAKNDEGKKDGYVQFGTYVNNVAASSYGTLLMVGDFDAFADYYRAMGKTDAQVLNSVYKTYINNQAKWGTDKGLNIKGKNGATIAVYAVDRTSYMWKNADSSNFQYALRVKTEAGNKYYGVGYALKDDGSVIFSAEIQNYNK